MENREPNELNASYLKNGFVVIRGLVSAKKIDSLLENYKKEVLFSNDYYLRQSTGKWQKNTLDQNGNSVESFLNVHDFRKQEHFATCVREIQCSDEVQNALRQITCDQSHKLIQSMLFDMNTATKAHQDWFYLDTVPNGHLLAGWFALEDIQEEAGRFFVIPGSHKSDFTLTENEKNSNPLYLKKLTDYMKEHHSEIVAPALKKGDVLFWNSGTIHGALETKDISYSRKSLTAHYVPSQYGVGRKYDDTLLTIETGMHNGMEYRMYPNSNYSMKAKIKSDVFLYLWNHPRLMRLAQKTKKLIERNL
ncbi:MAG: phytanoyl-CoA dioxygenase family protein [Bacteriovoracia bacterium]